jgi:hypothetical protein
LRQMDIGNAFVEAYLPPGEEVYMEAIPGFEKPGYVIKLVKSLSLHFYYNRLHFNTSPGLGFFLSISP